MQFKLTKSQTQRLLTLTTFGLGLHSGNAIAQTAPAPIFQETFLNGVLTTSTPNQYAVGGTRDNTGSSVCLTASQNQAQGPIAGCAPGSAALPIGGDTIGNGALRLTSNRLFSAPPRSVNDPGEEGFFIINQSLSSAEGLIFEFEFFSYAGQNFGSSGGGDGFSFFLIKDPTGNNAAVPAQAGAFGGSLGYAQKDATAERPAVPGLPNGYLGIGFDDFGNFSNSGEGRVGGNNPATETPNRIVLRGGADTQYAFLQSFTPTGSLSEPTTTTRNVLGRRGRISITPQNLLTVEVSFNGLPTGFVPIVQNFDLRSIPGQPDLPPFFKFGFAASTGTSTAIHEIRNLSVRPINNPPVPPPPPPPPTPPPPTPPPVQIFRLVKRVTAITRSSVRTEFTTFVDDPNDPNDNVPGWNQLAGGLGGLTRTSDRIQTGDEVEYTIYYLAEGDTTLVGSTICDQIPENSSFVPSSNLISQTNQTPTPSGQVFNKLQPIVPADNACTDQRNPNGTVRFDLGNLPVTAGNNFGFVRFRTKVN